jgi:phosphate:Na+ symporter
MRNAVLISDEVGALPRTADQTGPAVETLPQEKEVAANRASAEQATVELEHCAKTLGELRLANRKETLGSVAAGGMSADDAIARVDTVRRLEALARHAWRSAAYLVGSTALSGAALYVPASTVATTALTRQK